MPRSLWPSEAATQRILNATGIVPRGLDVDALRADLYQCRRDTLAKQIDTAAHRKGHKKAAAATIEHAQALLALLKSSGSGLFDRQLWSALDPGDYENAGVILDRIAREADRIAREGIDVVTAGSGPKDYVVGLLIPIYKRHFKRPAGTAHDGSGPFPRFVEAVSAYMGSSIRVSRHTVHKSLAARGRNVGKK
jgi:hypothetical protein